MSDRINREDAIEAVVCHIWHMPNEAYKQFNCENVVRDVVADAINRIPSAEAEQVTNKLKNLCDSLLISDSNECKEQKSKLDLISRQDAINAMWKALYAYEDLTEKQFMEHEELEFEDWFLHRIFVQRMHEECMKAVESLPSAEPKTGEWIFNPKDAIELMFTLPKCSECGFESSDGSNFCPNCGARMDGGEEE